MIDGRILVGDRLLGCGFCIADLTVVTAAHVVDGLSPADLTFEVSNFRVGVESMRISKEIDVALLRLGRPMVAVPRLIRSETLAQWSVTSQPRGNDPALGGVITARRKITNIHRAM